MCTTSRFLSDTDVPRSLWSASRPVSSKTGFQNASGVFLLSPVGDSQFYWFFHGCSLPSGAWVADKLCSATLWATSHASEDKYSLCRQTRVIVADLQYSSHLLMSFKVSTFQHSLVTCTLQFCYFYFSISLPDSIPAAQNWNFVYKERPWMASCATCVVCLLSRYQCPGSHLRTNSGKSCFPGCSTVPEAWSRADHWGHLAFEVGASLVSGRF